MLSMQCAICNESEALKKNSHIIPLCIINSLVASDQSGTSRDRELSFSISPNQFVKKFVGRDIQPDRIKELFGHDMANSISEDNVNQFSKDDIFCDTCEKRLGALEGKVKTSFLDVINIFRLGSDTLTEVKDNIHDINIFFYSIVFRMAIAEDWKIKLPVNVTKNLRILINNCINNKNENSYIQWYPMQLLVVEKREFDSENWVTYIPNTNSPYCIYLNQFVLFFYCEEKSLSSTKKQLMELETHIDLNIIRNKSSITINKITCADYDRPINQALENLAETIHRDLSFYFKEIYKMRYHKDPSNETIELFFTYLYNRDYHLGTYTKIGFATILHDFFNRQNLEG